MRCKGSCGKPRMGSCVKQGRSHLQFGQAKPKPVTPQSCKTPREILAAPPLCLSPRDPFKLPHVSWSRCNFPSEKQKFSIFIGDFCFVFCSGQLFLLLGSRVDTTTPSLSCSRLFRPFHRIIPSLQIAPDRARVLYLCYCFLTQTSPSSHINYHCQLLPVSILLKIPPQLQSPWNQMQI